MNEYGLCSRYKDNLCNGICFYCDQEKIEESPEMDRRDSENAQNLDTLVSGPETKDVETRKQE